MILTRLAIACGDISAETPRAASLNWFGLFFIAGKDTQILQISQVLCPTGQRLHDGESVTADDPHFVAVEFHELAGLPDRFKNRGDKQSVQNQVIWAVMLAHPPKADLLWSAALERERSRHDVKAQRADGCCKSSDIRLLNEQVEIKRHARISVQADREPAAHSISDSFVHHRIDDAYEFLAEDHA